VAAGANESFTVTLGYPTTLQFRVFAVVDATRAIEECNEGDNTARSDTIGCVVN